MSTGRTKTLLLLLGLLIIAGALEYTVGGGWKLVTRELHRKKLKAGNVHLAKGEQKYFEIPAPIGPENAPVKIVVYVNPYNHCHQDFLVGWQELVKPYGDKVRLEFKDITDKKSQKQLEGYPVGCETVAIINGLPQMKVPWLDEPLVFEGSIGPGASPETFKKLIDWLLTDEGQKEAKRQLAEFQKERKRRLEKQRKAEEAKKAKAQKPEKQKAKKQEKSGSESKAAPGSEEPAQPKASSTPAEHHGQSSNKAKKAEKSEKGTIADRIQPWPRPQPLEGVSGENKKASNKKDAKTSELKPDPARKEPMMPFSPDSAAESSAGACSASQGK